MAVLITGATGHLGPHLVAELLRSGRFDRLYAVARPGADSAAARIAAIERVARAQLATEGLQRPELRVTAIEAHLTAGALTPDDAAIRRIREDVTVIVHAAADTRFTAPLDALRSTNVEATRTLCQLAESCPRLRQFLHVSTTCVAGARTGNIPERLLDADAGFANAYEQSEWEAERIVVGSGLPVRIARLSTCAGSHVTGYVHRFGALHHLLHWMSRGLVPMVPGSESTPVDLISTDIAAAWLARAASQDPTGPDVCHVALGHDGVPLGSLVDFLIPVLDDSRRGRIQRPAIVEARVFQAFTRMVSVSGDALLSRVQTSAAAMLPSLLHPKIYDPANAARVWGAPLPHPDWRVLLSRVIAAGRSQGWGLLPAMEPSRA